MTPRPKTAKEAAAPKQKKDRFSQAKGGRKTANAIARVFANKPGILVNEKNFKEYFKTYRNQIVAEAPVKVLNVADKVGATVRVSGGGINAQADAVRNAIARALVKLNPNYRVPLKKAGFMTRDARVVERKKYGLHKARRAPQWAKR